MPPSLVRTMHQHQSRRHVCGLAHLEKVLYRRDGAVDAWAQRSPIHGYELYAPMFSSELSSDGKSSARCSGVALATTLTVLGNDLHDLCAHDGDRLEPEPPRLVPGTRSLAKTHAAPSAPLSLMKMMNVLSYWSVFLR